MPTVLISSPFDAYGGNEPYVFVSYAHIDAAAVYPEIKKMHQNGVRIWYDKGIEEGSEWPAEIEKALNNCTVFIVFLSKYSVESVNVRNEIHLALKKKKEFLAVYLEKTELKFGLELTISSLQHVTKRQTGEYWEKIWKFLTNHPEVFDPTKSQNVFTSANQSLVFNNDTIGLIDKHQNQKLVYPKFTNKQKYFGLGVISLLAIGIFSIVAMLFFADKTHKVPASPMVSNTTLAKNKNDAEVLKTKELVKTTNNKNSADPLLLKSNIKDLTPIRGRLLLAPFNEFAAKEKQNELAKSLQKKVLEVEDLGKGINLEMVLIPAGKFKQGEIPEIEKGRRNEVTLTQPYYMGKYEVTQAQWEAVMGNNPSSRIKGAKFPVLAVSWNDCQDFIKKLNTKTTGGYRFPTEAEWEYACRAGTTTAYSYGDSITKIDANIDGSSIKLVGSYKPNAFGLYDMHGNVREWCEDWKAEYPAAGAVTDPNGPETGTFRVLRSGAFNLNESVARSSDRGGNSLPTDRDPDYNGFRLARTVDIKAAVGAPTTPKPDPAVVMPATENLLAAPFTETKAKAVQKEVAKSLKKEVEEKADLGNGIKLEMVLIPAGKFMMGEPRKDHEVILTQTYYMGKHEVTQEQWELVMGNNPSSRNKGAKLPVTDVSWNDCQDFIQKVNAKTNGGYRLPTEAEWEYSCRAGTTTAYSVGDILTKNDANIDGSSIKSVGSYKANAFGLYDMHGNVWERCEDWYADFPPGTLTDPKGPRTGERRVMRSGSFDSFGSLAARSSDRYSVTLTGQWYADGFRLARTVDIKAAVGAPTTPKPDPAVVMPATDNLLAGPFTETKAKAVQKEVAKSLKKEVEEKADLGNGINLEMVLIPAGKFMMGSPVSEEGQGSDETQHEVILTRPYYLGKYEVTQEQWEAVMGNNPSSRNKGAKLPVTNISWHNCQEFIKRLNAKTDGGYRLPTEAEWEFACRSGTTTAYTFGDSITSKDANYAVSKVVKPVIIGSYNPNAFGLYDMHGNVWEWCEDWYGNYPVGAVNDPIGPSTGESRVLRGGSFNREVANARSSARFHNSPGHRNAVSFGFRLARTK